MSTSTQRTEHRGARLLALVGALVGAVYIGWRIVSSMAGAETWIAIPALMVEVVGFLGTSVLVWALWPAEGPTEAARRVRSGLVTPVFVRQSVDVAVRVSDQSAHDLRATLLAIRRVQRVGRVAVIDLFGREWVEQITREFGVRHVVPEANDRNGLRALGVAVRTPEFLLLDAGDVPSPDIVEALGAELCDPQVAVVQGRGVPTATDSPEHGARGRHDLEFENASLNPALGRRHVAVWTGTGSLVRMHALQTVLQHTVASSSPMEAQWRAGARMAAAGWRLSAPVTPVITHRLLADDDAVYADRTERARSARRLVFGRGGAIRSTLGLRARLGLLAWAVRPLSGFRRTLMVSVVVAGLISGALPFFFSAPWLMAVCFPGMLYSSVGLGLLSGWTLHLGDRVRHSLQTLSAAWRSLLPSKPRGGRRFRHLLASPSRQYGSGIVLVVLLLSVAIALRGTNERVLDIIPDMSSTRELMGLMLAALVLLAISLDVLHVMGGRGVVRRSARLSTSLDATINGGAGRIVDITSLGAGVVGVAGEYYDGDIVQLETQMLTAHGVTAMSAPSVVRNVRWDADGSSRLGVEFVHLDPVVANALVTMCKVEPAWQSMGSRVVGLARMVEERTTIYVDEEEAPRMGRLLVRAAAVMALAGAVTTAIPSVVDATPMMEHRLGGVVNVVDNKFQAVSGTVVTVVCSESAGKDGQFGTTDDVYDSPASVVTDAAGNYSLPVHGRACWSAVAPPKGFLYIAGNESGLAGFYAAGPGMNVLNASTKDIVAASQLREDPMPLSTGVGSLNSVVWRDLNADGIRQTNEPGMAGVTLTLFDVGGRTVARTVSDYFGNYGFHHLARGSYFVAASNLDVESVNISFTTATDDGRDANAILGRSEEFILGVGEKKTGINVGVHTRTVTQLTASTAHRVLPEVSAANLSPMQTRGEPLALLVVAMVITMFGSLIAAFVVPRRRTARGVNQWVASDRLTVTADR